MNEIYIVFENRKLSCNTDYENDGFCIIDDGEEVGVNLSPEELVKYIEKYHDDVNWEKIDVSDVDSIMEYMEEMTENIMFKYDFQYSSFIYQIFESEQDAKLKTKYLNEKFKTPYYYECFDITKKKAKEIFGESLVKEAFERRGYKDE